MSHDSDQPRNVSGVVAAWFDLHAEAVQQYAARRVGAVQAQDVVADTFRLALENFADYSPDRGPVRAWLFGIATNLLHRHWRAEQRRIRAYARSARQLPQSIDPLLDLDRRIDAERELIDLADAVTTLNPDDFDVLVLTAWEQMSSTEVAAVLGIPPGTVRSRLNRIRTHLHAATNDMVSDRGGSHDR